MNRRSTLRRGGIFALATGLLFLIAGDRGVTQVPSGIDPLEVLNLQIKPNVAIFLDTSGSMVETPHGTTVAAIATYNDHPGSKVYIGKQVLKSVVAANENNVNFLFGTYSYGAPAPSVTLPGLRINAQPNRFIYSTTSWAATASPVLPVQGPSPDMAVATTQPTLNSLYAFQWIQNSATIRNNQIRMAENGVQCTATITPGFYTTTTILTAIKAAMEACGPSLNTYTITYATGKFTFTRASGTDAFQLLWTDPASTFAAVLRQTVNQGAGTGPFTTANDARINLLQRGSGSNTSPSCATPLDCYDPDGAAGPSPIRAVTTYWLYAQKVWNGETVQVDGSGNACNIIPGTPTAPDPTVTLQRLAACGGAVVSTVTFTWSGPQSANGPGACQTGFNNLVPFFNCRADVTLPGIQTTTIAPFLRNIVPEDGAGGFTGYTEAQNGTGTILTNPAAGGLIAGGNTPMAQSFDGFRTYFGGPGGLWSAGQALPFPQNLTAISTHPSPKERTILIMVTDGDQNCSPFSLGGSAAGAPYNPTSIVQDDAAGLGTAMHAQMLYDPAANGTNSGTVAADGTINGDPGGSVTTYLVAFGSGADVNRANWIAWGGSGMNRSGSNVGTFGGLATWTTIPSAAERAACKTCVDAFVAPDAQTLTDILTKLLNQGATTGEFSSQQSLSDSVVEYVGEAPFSNAPGTLLPDPNNPGTRYQFLSPVRFASTFSMPLFTGKVRAFTNDGPDALAIPGATCLPGQACQRWDANANLVTRVTNGMTGGCPANATVGSSVGQCSFKRLAGVPSATDLNIRTSTAAIKRRIYTTSQNGVFGPTIDNLLLGQSPFRIALWPPQVISPLSVAPQDDTSDALFDVALGLPPNSTPGANQAAAFNTLQSSYHACLGSPLPVACTGTTMTQMQRARREAREMLLAFIAGAQFVSDSSGNPKRALATLAPDYTAGDIIYAARTSIVAESTLATPAVIGPVQQEEPIATNWVPEYRLYRDGPRCPSPTSSCSPVLNGGTSGYNPDTGNLILAGFGLRNPDADQTGLTVTGQPKNTPDSRTNLKPVMTVLYAGTNAGLHAFRAGPNTFSGPGPSFTPVTPPAVPVIPNSNPPVCTPSATVECGGEELWAFVPFDQLNKLQGRYLNNPQKRSPHDYMIARAIRFTDLFVPDPGTAANPSGLSVTRNNIAGSALSIALNGVWRKVMYFGRGAGGNYLTAIDVTAPGAFTRMSLDATGPIVLWNRGNPDTSDGQPIGGGNVVNNSLTGTGPGSDYDAYLRMGQTWSVPAVGFADRAANRTTRKAVGVDFVAYVGSGYGATGANPAQGTTFYTLDTLTGDVIKSVDVGARQGIAYDNAIVANPAIFNRSRFVYKSGGIPAPNVAAATSSRIFFGDLHGRLWKVLAAQPNTAIPGADLGSNQAVATAVAILGLPANDPSAKPHIEVTSGYESRATGPFFGFEFRDDGSDTDVTTQPGVVANGVTTFPPLVSIFTQDLGTNFRGTVQPSVVYSDTLVTGNSPAGRVFFGGTRFNPVGSQFAPTDEPCRSSFDSVVFALGVETGLAAYDFGPSRLFQNSRIAAITTAGSPAGSKLIIDEGLVKSGQPIPPPPAMGTTPSKITASSNVVPLQRPGQPLTTVRFGSTVCQ
jgi:hypothetical protein